jgi:hypothetical protein
LGEDHPPTTKVIHRDNYWEWLSPDRIWGPVQVAGHAISIFFGGYVYQLDPLSPGFGIVREQGIG